MSTHIGTPIAPPTSRGAVKRSCPDFSPVTSPSHQTSCMTDALKQINESVNVPPCVKAALNILVDELIMVRRERDELLRENLNLRSNRGIPSDSPTVDSNCDSVLAVQGTKSTPSAPTPATERDLERQRSIVISGIPELNSPIIGRRAWKSAAGYNLTNLFVGSEGTLGIITKAVLKLHARPQARAVAICHFNTVADAVNSVVETMQMGTPIARIEFMDHVQVAACNSYSKLSLAEQPTLALEFHGQNDGEVAEQAKFVGEICSSNGGSAFEWATELEDIEKLWTARHNAYYAALAMRTGASGFTTDVCVPISRLAEVIVETRRDLDKMNLKAAIVGHVGDGNFHVILPVFEGDDEEMKVVHAFSDRLVRRALSACGTCTGEHGIGVGKRPYLLDEFGPVGVELMKSIKRALDPNNIMNPGKIFA